MSNSTTNKNMLNFHIKTILRNLKKKNKDTIIWTALPCFDDSITVYFLKITSRYLEDKDEY